MQKPWFSFHLPSYTFPDAPPGKMFERTVEQARTAEACGFSQVTFMDHLYQIPNVGEVDDPMLEGYSVVSALARETRTGRLGTWVGGGGEQRTLRIAAKHADITHWFPLPMSDLQRKTDLLASYCEESGREASTIERALGSPVIVTRNTAEADAQLARIPPERREYMIAGPPEVAAEGLQQYVEAGFTGFTFNNTLYKTPDQIAAVGEVLRLL